MNLDFVLDNVGRGGDFSLLPKHSSAVSIEQKEEFYITPMLRDAVQKKNSKMILFSAPGATGKSALAKYISRKKKALLWDLSKDPIANHSYSGMLVESLGPKEFSRFTDGLITGEAVLVVDALDEAEMISGRAAIETLLMDLRDTVLDAASPNIVLCARTETAHFIRHFYEQENSRLDISQYEISFFADTDAEEFVKRKISQNRAKARDNRPVTAATVNCINSLFEEIKRLLDHDEESIRSFIGYAPVLEALAIYCDEENNTMQLVQKIQRANCSAEIFQKIVEYILQREQQKVINGFRERCIKDFPDYDNWDCVYTEAEQLIRVINYVLFGEIYFDAFTLNDLPRELLVEYKECVTSFLKDHPFVRMFNRADSPFVDFTGPAFRDYVLARLMTALRISDDCDEYAQSYFDEHCEFARFPSQLYFDLYEHFSGGQLRTPHFRFLYDAFKSKERTDFESSISIEQADEHITYIFRQDSASKTNAIKEAEFSAIDVGQILPVIQLNNAYVDVDCDVALGTSKKDVIISNSTVKCKKLLLQAENIMLVADGNGGILLATHEGIDSSLCPHAKFDIRTDEVGSLRISSPDIQSWFKLRKYSYALDDETSIDITKFEHAVRAILKYFRKDRKDAPGKHREYIDYVIVGKSPLKKDILEFFISKGIIYQDAKDPKQYKLSNQALESLGVYWGVLSSNSVGEMDGVYRAYAEWKQNLSN